MASGIYQETLSVGSNNMEPGVPGIRYLCTGSKYMVQDRRGGGGELGTL